MRSITLKNALVNYSLYRDLSAETRQWYKRIINVYCTFAGGDVTVDQFNGEQISLLLHAKQAAGCSSHYLRSLRNGLMALLREVRGNAPVERVRLLKTAPLNPEAWTPKEVERLIAACEFLPEAKRDRWTMLIAMAYYTGLDRCDLERLRQNDIADNGTIIFRRQKTKAIVVVQIPLPLIAMVREKCTARYCLKLGCTPEWFRKEFKKIVHRAGLFGTFKKLRKSSGSNVEAAKPGMGHKHLGNTRAIFERHYEALRITRTDPTMPPEIALPAARGHDACDALGHSSAEVTRTYLDPSIVGTVRPCDVLPSLGMEVAHA